MRRLKLLAGLALLGILAAAVGAATSLPGALNTTAGVATFGVVAVLVLIVVIAGVRWGGGPGPSRTPYW